MLEIHRLRQHNIRALAQRLHARTNDMMFAAGSEVFIRPMTRLVIACAALLLATQPLAASTLFVDPLFGVSVTNDVQYGSSLTGLGVNLPRFLDLYSPTQLGMGPAVPTVKPVIVLMHGGAFVSGDKGSTTMQTLANAFASRGYVAASINYRLLLDDDFPSGPGMSTGTDPARDPAFLDPLLTDAGATREQFNNEIDAAVADQAMAVNFFAANAAMFGINPNMIAVGGYSAGAVGSLLLGVGAIDGVSANVGAVLSLAGGLFGRETAMDPSDPAVFFVHGTLDETVPAIEADFLDSALDTQGVPHIRISLPGEGHSSGPLTTAALDPANGLFQFTINQLNANAVPEPSSVVLLALGAMGVAGHRRRRRTAA